MNLKLKTQWDSKLNKDKLLRLNKKLKKLESPKIIDMKLMVQTHNGLGTVLKI